ncbi:MAG: CYTH domain-containing protein [Prochlorococcaceae cyanobacterium]
MALEIERRFLVSGEHWRRHCCWSQGLQQGYLMAGADGLTLRVRIASKAAADGSAEFGPGKLGPLAAWLTFKAPVSGKAPAAGLACHEFEYPIPIADAEAMLALAPHSLRKRRYGLDLPGGDWVLDVFEGANAPLVVAEVELLDPQQPLAIPSWCVLELSGRHELSNAALSREPLAAWSPQARELLLAPLLSSGADPQGCCSN